MANGLDNNFNRAGNLGLLRGVRAVSDSVGANDKIDFYRFRVNARSSFQGAIKQLKSNVDFFLFDGNRKRIGASTKPGKQNESINTILDPGTYFVRINRKSGSTNYRLRLATSELAAPDPATAKFAGLTDNNTLAFFNSDRLNNVTKVGVTGLQANENLVGIDFRPNTGQLFGIGSTNRLYAIDATTGAATQVGTGTFAVSLNGTSFGVDFNPTVDRIRVVSDLGQNLRLNPDTGAVVDADLVTAGVQADGNLNGATSSIGATAYTNKFSGATTTIQYGIDATTDQLFIQNPPNAGTQTLVGALGVDFTANSGFNIVTRNGVNSGFAVSGSSLYTIDLNTGAATIVGTVRDKNPSAQVNLFGLAVRP
ncbi:DUF4394 domain-containing protein [Oculatella sp. LEGE 06141]|uniref:DUF4394 domain-containing protein n=1 Tax=Oculatella sp. LEGE 06141 TaxID=1828648 RepID=UPI0018822DB5|nr:DUF4394 domain-containing protein [Oculatella sp. LEGE 06141]MBE9178386.1 DUF4394 domain-containing protein [Oculatella sp. LEGE 06141]